MILQTAKMIIEEDRCPAQLDIDFWVLGLEANGNTFSATIR